MAPTKPTPPVELCATCGRPCFSCSPSAGSGRRRTPLVSSSGTDADAHRDILVAVNKDTETVRHHRSLRAGAELKPIGYLVLVVFMIIACWLIVLAVRPRFEDLGGKENAVPRSSLEETTAAEEEEDQGEEEEEGREENNGVEDEEDERMEKRVTAHHAGATGIALDHQERLTRRRRKTLERMLSGDIMGEWREAMAMDRTEEGIRPRRHDASQERQWRSFYRSVFMEEDIRKSPGEFAAVLNRASALIDALTRNRDLYETVLEKLHDELEVSERTGTGAGTGAEEVPENELQEQEEQQPTEQTMSISASLPKEDRTNETHTPLEEQSLPVEVLDDKEEIVVGIDERTNGTQHILPPTPSDCAVVTGCEGEPDCRTYLVIATDESCDFAKPPGRQTIWLYGVTRMLLAETKSRVHVLGRRPLPASSKDALSFQMIEDPPGVTILDPFHIRSRQCLFPRPAVPTSQGLKVPALRSIVEMLDERFHYRTIFLRDSPFSQYGQAVISLEKLGPRMVIFRLNRTGDLSHDVIMQMGAHEGIIHQWTYMNRFRAASDEGQPLRSVWLPPMVEQITAPRWRAKGTTICYIGSYDPGGKTDYMIREMLNGFLRARKTICDLALVTVFTRRHRLKESFLNMLRDTPGVTDLPPVDHEAALELMRSQCDVGVRGIRNKADRSFLDTTILSTKIIEYGSTSLPVILNPVRIHKQLLGDDYPLFWQYEDPVVSFAEAVVAALKKEEVYAKASMRVRDMATSYTFTAVRRSFDEVMDLRDPPT